MKNSIIRSQTLANLKVNDLELTGNDLQTSAHLISDLISSPPYNFADQDYKDRYFDFAHDGPELSACKSTTCPVIDGLIYELYFNGRITVREDGGGSADSVGRDSAEWD